MLSNYDFDTCIIATMRAGEVANEIIHSSQLSVFRDETENPGDGLLVASDWHMKRRVLHLPIVSLRSIVNATLDNAATIKVDWWDHETNKVFSKRE